MAPNQGPILQKRIVSKAWGVVAVMIKRFATAFAGLSLTFAGPVAAITPRDLLVQAAFQTPDKQAAITKLRLQRLISQEQPVEARE